MDNLAFEPFLLHFINSPALGVIAGASMMLGFLAYGLTDNRQFMFQGFSGAAFLAFWLNRQAFLDVVFDQPVTNASATGGFWPVVALGLAIVLALALGIGTKIYRVAGEVEPLEAPKSPAAETSAPNPLQPLIGWLRRADYGLPEPACAALARIRRHLEALSDQIRPDSPTIAEVSHTITDLRDLIVFYNRAEVARKWLPTPRTSPGDLLLGGVTRIERTIANAREAVADEELKQLQIQGRYIDLKHGQTEVQ